MDSTAGPAKKRTHASRGEVLNFSIPGYAELIALRLYRPAGALPMPVVLYFHGGGFTSGSLNDAQSTAEYISRHCPAIVAAVDYSLAPANPFPAAIEDAYASLLWLDKHAKEIGADLARTAVAGDDAGGNLAAILPIVARDRHAFPIAAQVLIGPMLDPSMVWLGDADRLRSDINEQTCLKCYSQYLPLTMQRMHPYAAPLESRRLAGLPPALIITAECDVLHVEAEKYAAALINAGVPTQVYRLAKAKHNDLRDHAKVLIHTVDFLRARLSPEALS